MKCIIPPKIFIILLLFSCFISPAMGAECSKNTYTTGNVTNLSFITAGTCNWTIPYGVQSVGYDIAGGGGSGGGADTTSLHGGGGGSSTRSRGTLSIPLSQVLMNISVGAGGTGTLVGQTGKVTVLNNTITANGGSGGIYDLSGAGPGGNGANGYWISSGVYAANGSSGNYNGGIGGQGFGAGGGGASSKSTGNAGGSGSRGFINLSYSVLAVTTDFTASTTTGASPLSVTFTDTSTGTYLATAWSWEFGDGNTSTTQNPTYIYPSVGNYTVTLTTTNYDGTHTLTKINYITATNAPYVPLMNNGYEYGTGSVVPISTAWYWIGSEKYGKMAVSSSDYQTSTVMFDANVSHSGSKSMKIITSNAVGTNYSFVDDGAYGSVTNHRFIVDPGKTYNFSVWLKSSANDYVTQVRIVTSPQSDVYTTAYTCYAASVGGTFDWTRYSAICDIPAGNNTGNVQFFMYRNGSAWLDDVKLMKMLTPSAYGNVTIGTIPFTVAFNGSATNGTATYWNWSFGDGYYSELQNPIHTYTAPGTFTVSLTAANGIGNENPSKITLTNYIVGRSDLGFSDWAPYGSAWISKNLTYTSIMWNTTGNHIWSPTDNIPWIGYMVVAGGGGGGGVIGGGGGAGGLLYNSNYTISKSSYNITVGNGGDGGHGWNWLNQDGKPGTNSSFDNSTPVNGIQSNGGGGGSWHSGNTTTGILDGGSGGGGAQGHYGGGIGISGQGNNGGDNTDANNYGAGGGGKVTRGNDTTTVILYTESHGGNGGLGIPYDISGDIHYYAAGGGGGVRCGYGSAGDGGNSPVGGVGSATTITAANGLNGRGGGGGGGGYCYSPIESYNVGGNGGSGVVIIQYKNLVSARFMQNDSYGNRLLPVLFNDTSSGGPTSWQWIIKNVTGNNTPIIISTSQNTTFIFDVGNWKIQLNATSASSGNISTQNSWVNVTQLPPISDFITNISTGVPPFAVQFTDTSTRNPSGWSWYFGDETYTDVNWIKQTNASEWVSRGYTSAVTLSDGHLVLMGGMESNAGTRNNETWRSIDNGVHWTLVNGSSGWNPRSAINAVVLSDDSIIMMSGWDDAGRLNDVWKSTDEGTTWELVTSTPGWTARHFASIVALSDDTILLMGGSDVTGYLNDTWKSTNKGITWSLVNSNPGWQPRYAFNTVLTQDNTVLLIGGGGPMFYNDTWKSTDKGTTWSLVNSNPGWQPRYTNGNIQVIPDNTIIMFGGLINTGVRVNDTWKSSDGGITWNLTNASAGWISRYGHTSTTLADGSIELIGGFNTSGGSYNDTWRFDPASSHLQNPSHIYTSMGNYSVKLLSYNDGGWNISKSQYIIAYLQFISQFIKNDTYGHTLLLVLFNDTSPVIPTSWQWIATNVTGNNTPITFSNSQNLTTVFDVGNWKIQLNASNSLYSNISVQNLWVNVTQLPPIANFVADTYIGYIPLYAAFNDTSLRNPYGWAWYFGNEDYTRKFWVRQTSSAEWPSRYSAALATTSDGDIIMIGGYNNYESKFYNETWRSSDKGITWQLLSNNNKYAARAGLSAVLLSDDSIVIFGGYDSTLYYNDTWRSTDKGVTWELMNTNPGWVARRFMGSSSVNGDGIILTGGYATGGIFYNDTWVSTDKGLTWSLRNISSGWVKRARHSITRMVDNSLILTGGYTSGSGYPAFNDTWRSTDSGITWNRMNSSGGWVPRIDLVTIPMPDNSMIMTAGYNETIGGLNDTWRMSTNGTNWTLVNISSGFTARWVSNGISLPDGSAVLIGGYDGGATNDTWRFNPNGSYLQNPYGLYGNYNNFTPYRVILQAYNDGGYNISDPQYIDARLPLIIPSFIKSNDTGIILNLVNFTDTSLYSPIEWNWSYTNVTGNNTEIWFDTGQNPHYIFPVGNWSIRLTASNPYGSNTSQQNTSFVNITLPAPVASFTTNTTSGINWVLVQFTDTSTNVPTAWDWIANNVTGNNTDFSFSTAHNPNLYFYSGNWSIKLNASSIYGYNKTPDLYFINISNSYAAFYPNMSEGVNELPVQFIDNSVTFGSIISWTWNATNFGGTDHTPFYFSSDQYPIHIFGKGNYSIVLKIVDEYGFSATSHQTTFINVSPFSNASTITYPTLNTPYLVTLFVSRDQAFAGNLKVSITRGNSYEDAIAKTELYSTGYTDSYGKYSFMSRDNMYYYIDINDGEYKYMYMGSSTYTTITCVLPTNRLVDRPYAYDISYDDNTSTIITTYDDVDPVDVNIMIYDMTFNGEVVRDVDYTSVLHVSDSFGVPYSDHEYKVNIDFKRSISNHEYKDTKYVNSKTFHSPIANASDQWRLFVYALYSIVMMIVSLSIGYASPKIGSVLLLGLTLLGISMGFLPFSMYTGGVLVCGFIAMLEVMRRRQYYNY
jgi:PKD repeat protein